MEGTSPDSAQSPGESSTPAAVRELGSAVESYLTLNANSLAWDHHPRPLLRSSISAQVGAFSPCRGRPQLCSLVCAHTSWLDPTSWVRASLQPHTSSPFCYCWSDTRWSPGLTDPFSVPGPCDQRSAPIQWDGAGVGQSTACVTCDGQLVPPARGPCSCCFMAGPSLKKPAMHAKKSVSTLLI